MRVAFDPVKEAVLRRLRVTGEEIAREVHRIDIVLSAEVAEGKKVNALAGILEVRIQQFAERKGIQRRLEKRAARVLDRRQGSRGRGPRQARDRGAGQERRALEKAAPRGEGRFILWAHGLSGSDRRLPTRFVVAPP